MTTGEGGRQVGRIEQWIDLPSENGAVRRFVDKSFWIRGDLSLGLQGGGLSMMSALGTWRSLVSALVWGTRGRRFKSGRPDHFRTAGQPANRWGWRRG